MRFLLTLISGGALLAGSMAQAAEINHDRLDANTEIILIEGEILSSDLDKFRRISLRHPKAIVLLNSDGGLIRPAIEIGKIIRVAGYETAVLDADSCASACALIWMAGSKKIASSKGNVGFHASYLNNSGELVQSGVANALVGNYLTSLGASAKAVVFATTAPPDRILWLTESNREIAGIDFELWSRSRTVTGPPKPAPAKHIRPQPSVPPMLTFGPKASRAVRPLTQTSSWISWDDFPYKALKVAHYRDLPPGLNLTVTMLLDITQVGRVSRCQVTGSSSLPALDQATCKAMLERGSYLPALDQNGDPVAAVLRQTVNWTK